MKIEDIIHMNDHDLLKLEDNLIKNHDYKLVTLLEPLDFIFADRFGRKFGELEEVPFDIEITETLQKSVRVLATSSQEAMRIVKGRYMNSEIVLSAGDYSDYDLECIQDIRVCLELIRALFK